MTDPKSEVIQGGSKWGRRLLWFVALWVAGVLIVATVAYAIRAVIL